MGFMDKVYRQLGLTDPEEEILEREEAELRADELAAKARKEKAMDLEKTMKVRKMSLIFKRQPRHRALLLAHLHRQRLRLHA